MDKHNSHVAQLIKMALLHQNTKYEITTVWPVRERLLLGPSLFLSHEEESENRYIWKQKCLKLLLWEELLAMQSQHVEKNSSKRTFLSHATRSTEAQV